MAFEVAWWNSKDIGTIVDYFHGEGINVRISVRELIIGQFCS